MRRFRSLVVLQGISVALAAFISGCSGSSGSGPTPPPPSKTTPSVAFGTEASITYGTALSATQLNATSNVAGTFAYTPAAGTILAAGTQTLSVSFTPTDTTDYNNASATTTIVVAKATPVVTWAAPASITNAIALSSTQLNATASVPGTFVYTPAAGTMLAAGVDALNVTFTPTDTTDYVSPVTATVNITVTLAPPTITSLNYSTIYCETYGLGCAPQFNITGTNFAAGDILSLTLLGNITLNSGTAPNLIGEQLFFNNYDYSPGWETYQDCRPGGTTCSNGYEFAALPVQNTLAVSAAGELFQLDQAQGNAPPALGGTGLNGYVRKFQASGATLTADGSFYVGYGSYNIAYDDVTGRVFVGNTSYDANGGSFSAPTTNVCGANNIIGASAKNGYAAFTCPSANQFATYPTTPLNPTANHSSISGQPSSIAMGITGTQIYAYVLTRDGTPTLHKINAATGIETASLALTGFTPISTVQATHPFAGGWQVVYGQGGAADQTVAVLSTPDNLIIFVNSTTMTEEERAKINPSFLPFLAAYDATHGKYIVASANPATTTTTFASVDPSTGTVTNLTSQSSLLAAGLAVSADGKYLYICMRATCETQPNQ